MGGIGSGRHAGFGLKHVTNDYRAIDVRLWHRENLLKPGRSFKWTWSIEGKPIGSIQVHSEAGHVILAYNHRSHNRTWANTNYAVHLDWTPCHYGGERPWFLCPAMGCGRRVALLYGGATFACRHCYELIYQSQRESSNDRALRRANSIREQLGWEPGILNGGEMKPKGMHWSTFKRIIAEYGTNVTRSLSKFAD